jgi:hypothetical protein
MKILFEREVYNHTLLEQYGLTSYAHTDRDNKSIIPYVGYFYSSKINDCIFILPKVFIKQDDTCDPIRKIAFGKEFKDGNGEYLDIYSIIDVNPENNPLKAHGLDRMVFELSTWIYRAIDRFWIRHHDSDIIKRETSQTIISVNGENNQTLLDTILSLVKFHKKHSDLFTYISIINSTGYNKIHWPKTINKVQPVIQNGKPYYMEFKNKNNAFNYDEDLIVLYYSVLQYLKKTYMFAVQPNINYDLIRPSKIQSMIENGRGTKLLRKIRRKYFKDELVQLWKLLFAFFSKAENIQSGKCSNEALLASTFDRVFEDMVDVLVSQDIFADLKKNKDNKRIDHIYKGMSLLGDGEIFYIGDSKYYSDGHDIDPDSIYKQFTYAKNIIQHNIDLHNKKQDIDGIRYRDKETDGYNFTPNFFIRGHINLDELKDGKACYNEDKLEPHEQEFDANYHFSDRPFDRDTLLLQSYNINFLYVLASYVNDTHSGEAQKRLHKLFRDDLIKKYETEFDFYKVTPTIDNKEFLKKHFYEYRGQMYSLGNGDIIFGFNSKKDDAKYQAKLIALRTKFSGEASVTEYKLQDSKS